MPGQSDGFDTPEAFAAARDELLSRIVAVLRSDTRVVGAWLAGSQGRGEGDEWADLDLHIVVKDEALAAFLSERPDLFNSLDSVSLVQDEIPGQGYVGDQFNLVVFRGGLEVDWSFVASSEARKPAGHKLLFERQPIPASEPAVLSDDERRTLARRWSTFFWAMAPIAARLCARGDTRRAANQTGLLTRALISLWRLTEQTNGPDPWLPGENVPLEDELDGRIPRLDAILSPDTVLRHVAALCELAEALQSELRRFDAAVSDDVIADTHGLLTLANGVVESGQHRPRKFR